MVVTELSNNVDGDVFDVIFMDQDRVVLQFNPLSGASNWCPDTNTDSGLARDWRLIGHIVFQRVFRDTQVLCRRVCSIVLAWNTNGFKIDYYLKDICPKNKQYL